MVFEFWLVFIVVLLDVFWGVRGSLLDEELSVLVGFYEMFFVLILLSLECVFKLRLG